MMMDGGRGAGGNQLDVGVDGWGKPLDKGDERRI